MVKLFNQPYPLDESPGRELRKSVLIGLFVGLFLLLFQPFNLGLWHTPHKAIKILGFGLITCLITAFNTIVWPRIFPKLFAEEHWTVAREILLTTTNVLLIAVGNRLYLDWLLGGEDSGLGWVSMILVTFLIALFPSTGMVLLNYIRQLKKYSSSATDLSVHTNSDHQPADDKKSADELIVSDPTVMLLADNEKDELTMPADNLLFIESSDNYCTVVYLKNDRLAKPLLRSSLGRLEKQIVQSYIVRCHRSYVVNLNRVERVTGNAQGYKLHMQDGQLQIPVARQYNESLVDQLKARV